MEQNKDFPNFWAAVLILSLLVGVQIILAIIAYDMGLGFRAGDPGASGVIIVLSCGFVFSLLMAYKKIRYKDIFNPTRNSTRNIIIVLALPMMLTLGGAVFWIDDITNLIILYFPLSGSDQQMFLRLTGGGVVTIVTVCIIGPVIEEMLFRGIILRSFLENYSARKSILLSAILFAAYHLNIYQIPVAFFVGCLFGWVYVRTRSLWPSIMGHIFYNAVSTALSWSVGGANHGADMKATFYSWNVNLVAVTATVVGLLLLVNLLQPSRKTRS